MEPVTELSEVDYREQPSLWELALKGGLITGAVLFLLTLIFQYIMGMYGNVFFMMFMGVLAIIIGIILTHRGFKREGNGYMSYGQGLALAVISMAVAGFLAGLLSFLYMQFIDPEIPVKMADASIDTAYAMAERMGGEIDDATEAKLEEARTEAIAKGVSFSSTVLGTALIYLCFGLFWGLIISAFTKNNNPEQVY